MNTLPSVLALLACVFRAPAPGSDSSAGAQDTDGGGGVGQDGASEPGLAVVLTANAVLSEGWLATVSLEDGARSDGLVETAGDAALADLGGSLLLLDRFDGARARILDPDDWAAEPQELPVDGGPYDAIACGGAIYISRYQAGDVVALDPETGAALAALPLPGDPAGLAVIGETLYVALHALDPETYTPLNGAIAAVDCASNALVETWEMPGPLPSIQAWPGRPDRLAVRLGATDLHGGLYALYPETGALSSLLREGEVGGIADFALSEAGGVLLTYDQDWSYQILCFSDFGDGEGLILTEGERPAAQLVDVAITPGGRAWIAARPRWDEPDGDSGLIVYDLETCTSLTGPDWFKTSEPPWRVLIR